MKLNFLGTRGEIEAQTRQHRMHTALLVFYRGKKVMIDCGLDWLGKFERLVSRMRIRITPGDCETARRVRCTRRRRHGERYRITRSTIAV